MIHTICPNCSAKINAPDKALGRIGNCPKCKVSFTIEAIGFVAAEDHAGDFLVDNDEEIAKRKMQAAATEKQCPMCAELIKVEAKKCKHCGELLDPDLAAARQSNDATNRDLIHAVIATRPQKKKRKVDWLLTLLFSWIYFLVKGWAKAAVVALLLSVLTGGLAWLIIPFFAQSFVDSCEG